ncbi:alpha/beta hydrolase [Sphingomonas montana]|uniref:alpha/beta hydrolase n=1 Tax=Sphingomonas montana TaxID=1843236 RepID=UPI00096D70A2|nr:alpha/beta hydrolase [Sphingomonas montana]
MRAALLTLLIGSACLGGCSDLVRDKIYLAPDTPVTIGNFTRSAPQELRVALPGTGALQGFYWPGERTDRDIILFFHGRRASQGVGAKYAEYFAGKGDSVLVASYPGFAGNPGRPSEASMLAAAHAFAVEARRLKGPDARLWMVGHSLGAAVAIEAAGSEHAAGIVAISPFTRLSAAAPWATRAFVVDPWDNLATVRRSRIPLLLIHGLDDRIVPPEQSRTLLDAAAGPTVLVTMADRAHKPQMHELGPFITEGIAAMGSGAFAGWPQTAPAGWTIARALP